MLRGLSRDERGAALVVALFVVMVVMLLSTYVVSQAIHNVEQSAGDRARLQSVSAAEAGIDHFYAFLAAATPADIAASGCAVTQDLGTAPQTASFTATITLYGATGQTIPCASAATVLPSAVLIRSTGVVNGRTPRRMESYVQLRPVYGGFDAAILSDAGLSLVNQLTVNGYQGNDADIYVNTGNVSISNHAAIAGSVYAAGGGGTLSNNTRVAADVWVNGPLTLQNSALIQGDAISSTSSISLTNSARVDGDATAGTTITLSNNASIGGVQRPNAPSPTPPTKTFPQITGDTAPWASAGFTVQSYTSCTSAKNALNNQTITGNVLIRVNAVCQLSFTGNASITFNGDLAIVTDGSIRSANNVRWNGVGGTRRLYLISAYRPGLSCASGSYNVIDANNVSYNSANVLFYSPCTVQIANNTGFDGQIIAGTARIANNFTMDYRPLVVPGAGVTGFQQDIAYIREVT